MPPSAGAAGVCGSGVAAGGSVAGAGAGVVGAGAGVVVVAGGSVEPVTVLSLVMLVALKYQISPMAATATIAPMIHPVVEFALRTVVRGFGSFSSLSGM